MLNGFWLAVFMESGLGFASKPFDFTGNIGYSDISMNAGVSNVLRCTYYFTKYFVLENLDTLNI